MFNSTAFLWESASAILFKFKVSANELHHVGAVLEGARDVAHRRQLDIRYQHVDPPRTLTMWVRKCAL